MERVGTTIFAICLAASTSLANCASLDSATQAQRQMAANPQKALSVQPRLITLSDSERVPSAMQEVAGVLRASPEGCIVLETTSETLVTYWRESARLVNEGGVWSVNVLGRKARIGDEVTLSGTGLGRPSADFARRKNIPDSCRTLNGFSANGILR